MTFLLWKFYSFVSSFSTCQLSCNYSLIIFVDWLTIVVAMNFSRLFSFDCIILFSRDILLSSRLHGVWMEVWSTFFIGTSNLCPLAICVILYIWSLRVPVAIQDFVTEVRLWMKLNFYSFLLVVIAMLESLAVLGYFLWFPSC